MKNPSYTDSASNSDRLFYNCWGRIFDKIDELLFKVWSASINSFNIVSQWIFVRTIMKKSLVSLLIGASLAFSATAQDQAGGNTSGDSAENGIATSTIATGVVAAGIAAAVISNNRGSSDIDDGVVETPTCNGTDEINSDGFCVGTTNTVTSLTGTATTMTAVTFTYEPSL